jgi:rubrerythrin
MNKEREITIDIISNCLKIDTEACNLYKKFIKISPDKSLKKFWQEMVEVEKEHI